MASIKDFLICHRIVFLCEVSATVVSMTGKRTEDKPAPDPAIELRVSVIPSQLRIDYNYQDVKIFTRNAFSLYDSYKNLIPRLCTGANLELGGMVWLWHKCTNVDGNIKSWKMTHIMGLSILHKAYIPGYRSITNNCMPVSFAIVNKLSQFEVVPKKSF